MSSCLMWSMYKETSKPSFENLDLNENIFFCKQIWAGSWLEWSVGSFFEILASTYGLGPYGPGPHAVGLSCTIDILKNILS